MQEGRSAHEAEGEEKAWGTSGAGENLRSPEIAKESTAVAVFTATEARARAESVSIAREEKELPRDTPRRGLYVPAAGSPGAPNVAPDASGDHQTKT